MLLSEIMESLEEFCPLSFAEKWDNCGLQAGRSDKEVGTVYLALDATGEVTEDAIRQHADLILTHHPLLFNGIRNVTDKDHVGRRLVRLLREDMAVYSMHTNFDVMGMADAAAYELNLMGREVLEVTYEDAISHEGLGRIGELPEHMPLQELAELVRDTFHVSNVRVYGDAQAPVIRVAILPGSGKDEIDTALKMDADVLITGDITHHAGIDAIEKGIYVIDAGHYGVEKLFIPYMEEFLHRELPQLRVIKAPEHEPYFTV